MTFATSSITAEQYIPTGRNQTADIEAIEYIVPCFHCCFFLFFLLGLVFAMCTSYSLTEYCNHKRSRRERGGILEEGLER